jgi:hypothetical protein
MKGRPNTAVDLVVVFCAAAIAQRLEEVKRSIPGNAPFQAQG